MDHHQAITQEKENVYSSSMYPKFVDLPILH